MGVSEQIREKLSTLRAEAAATERLLRVSHGDKQLLRLVADIAMSIGSLEVLLDREDAA